MASNLRDYSKKSKYVRRKEHGAHNKFLRETGSDLDKAVTKSAKGRQAIMRATERSGGSFHTTSADGVSKHDRESVRRAAFLAMRKDPKFKNMSSAERARALKGYMKTFDKMFGKNGKYTKQKRKELKKAGASSAHSKTLSSGPSQMQLARKAERIERSRDKTISAGREVARELQTGFDREGNRVSYGADRGMGSSASLRPGGGIAQSGPQMRPSTSHPQY